MAHSCQMSWSQWSSKPLNLCLGRAGDVQCRWFCSPTYNSDIKSPLRIYPQECHKMGRQAKGKGGEMMSLYGLEMVNWNIPGPASVLLTAWGFLWLFVRAKKNEATARYFSNIEEIWTQSHTYGGVGARAAPIQKMPKMVLPFFTPFSAYVTGQCYYLNKGHLRYSWFAGSYDSVLCVLPKSCAAYSCDHSIHTYGVCQLGKTQLIETFRWGIQQHINDGKTTGKKPTPQINRGELKKDFVNFKKPHKTNGKLVVYINRPVL